MHHLQSVVQHSINMPRKLKMSADERLVHRLEYGEYDRLTPQHQQHEVHSRGIDPSTAHPGVSMLQLLLRDDDPAKKAAITHNQTNVAFIRLPAEIRNTIYALIIEHYNNTLPAHQLRYFSDLCYITRLLEPSFMRSCNFIRREMVPMYYATRSIVFEEENHSHWPMIEDRSARRSLLLLVQAWAEYVGRERLRAAKEIKVKLRAVTVNKAG